MSTLKLSGLNSGSSIIKAPDSGSTGVTFTLPASAGTLAKTTDAGVAGITSSADGTAITIDSSEKVNFNQGRLQLGHINKFIDTANYVGDAINIGSHPFANGTVIGQSYPADSPTTIKRTIHTTGTETKFFTVSGATETERVRIDQHGIKFNGDTAAANALDDYEEGTWTPTVTCTTSGSYTLDGGSNLLAYTKVGRVVHISGYIQINGESSPNGNLRITLPFTSFNGTDDTDYAMGNAIIANHGGNMPSNINLFVTNNSAYGYPWGVNDNGTTFYVAHDDVDTNFQFGVSMTYIAA